LILRKVVKIVATRCHILKLKWTKFNFGPHWGSLQHSTDPQAGFKGPTSRGGKAREGKGRRKRKGKEEYL